MKTNHIAGLLLGTAFVLAGCNVQTNAGPKPSGRRPTCGRM